MNVDRRFSQEVRAERHKLLGDARRLVIVEALEEGPRQIPELARLLGVHTTTVREVVDTLKRLSFDPGSATQRNGVVSVDVRNWPFSVDPRDPNGAVVCAFHKGLVQGLAEVASGDEVGVGLLPFVAPGVCRVELSAKEPATGERRKRTPT